MSPTLHLLLPSLVGSWVRFEAVWLSLLFQVWQKD